MKIKVINEKSLMKVKACIDCKVMKRINQREINNSEFEKESNEKYVTQIIAESDGKTLFSVSTSPNVLIRVYRHIYPRFEFNHTVVSDELQVTTINNDGKQIKESVKIKINNDLNNSSSKLLPNFTAIDFRKTNLKAFESNTVAQAIIELYNTSVALTRHTNDINLEMLNYTL